jgi:hypothetical protein
MLLVFNLKIQEGDLLFFSLDFSHGRIPGGRKEEEGEKSGHGGIQEARLQRSL